MTLPGKIIVTTAHMECSMCPTVVCGVTTEGETIRARYRWGRLVIRLDPRDSPLGGAGGAWIMDEQLDPEGLAGCLTYDEIREITADIIDWPDELSLKIFDEDKDTTFPED